MIVKKGYIFEEEYLKIATLLSDEDMDLDEINDKYFDKPESKTLNMNKRLLVKIRKNIALANGKKTYKNTISS